VTSRRLGVEVLLVLGLSLGESAVRSVISLVGKLTAEGRLAEQSAALNAAQTPRPYLDLAYQLEGILFALVPVALVLWLLGSSGAGAGHRMGLDRSRWRGDLAWGVGLAAAVGLPGLVWYLVGRLLGVTAEVVPAPELVRWWTIPVLLLAAVKNGLLEEVVVVGYLVTRLRDLRWPAVAALVASSLLRGSYHLYQGFGPFLGNVAMGVLFAAWFLRTRRVVPLVVAHTLIDVVAFVGYLVLGPLGS
jgi:membrane protease YdiL (CAAX protease family)